MFKDETLASRAGNDGNGRARAQGDVGFVGLGRMGVAMATNLAAAGHRVSGLCPPSGKDGQAGGARPQADDGYRGPVRVRGRDHHVAGQRRGPRRRVRTQRPRPGWSRRRPDARRGPSLDEHDQHRDSASPRQRARAVRAGLCRRAGVSGIRTPPRLASSSSSRPASPSTSSAAADLRHSRPADVRCREAILATQT